MRLGGQAGALYPLALALLSGVSSPPKALAAAVAASTQEKSKAMGLGRNTLEQRLDGDRLCFILGFLVCSAGPGGGKLVFLF